MLSANWDDQPFADDVNRSALLEGRPYFPDSSHDGWFDYASGIVGINALYDPDDNPEQRGSYTVCSTSYVVRVHESFHLFQAVTLPWFWRWCLDWRKLSIAGIRTDLNSAEYRAELRDLPQMLQEETRERIKIYLHILTEQGKYGLSPLLLLEAHATLGEIWTLARHDSITDVCIYLEQNVPNDGYRLAFDIARLTIGDDLALEAFAPLVAAAFCFHAPVRAFYELLDRLRADPSTELSITALCQSVRDTDLSTQFYGLPSTEARGLVESSNSIPHAVNCGRVLSACAEYGVSLDELLADRYAIKLGSMAVDPTCLYAPDDDGRAGVIVSGFHENMDLTKYRDIPEYESYLRERFIMVRSQRLLRAGGAEEAPGVQPAYSWLSAPNETFLPLPPIVLPLNDMTPVEYAEKIVSQLSIRNVRAPVDKVTTGLAYLGRGVLEFSTYSDLEVWQIPDARAIVRALSAICPEFPIFLKPDLSTLVVWFGCLTDMEGVYSTGFDIMHPSAERALERFSEGVDQVVKDTGLDITPIADLLLDPIHAARRKSL